MTSLSWDDDGIATVQGTDLAGAALHEICDETGKLFGCGVSTINGLVVLQKFQSLLKVTEIS